jgi:hypothetical protein
MSQTRAHWKVIIPCRYIRPMRIRRRKIQKEKVAPTSECRTAPRCVARSSCCIACKRQQKLEHLSHVVVFLARLEGCLRGVLAFSKARASHLRRKARSDHEFSTPEVVSRSRGAIIESLRAAGLSCRLHARGLGTAGVPWKRFKAEGCAIIAGFWTRTRTKALKNDVRRTVWQIYPRRVGCRVEETRALDPSNRDCCCHRADKAKWNTHMQWSTCLDYLLFGNTEKVPRRVFCRKGCQAWEKRVKISSRCDLDRLQFERISASTGREQKEHEGTEIRNSDCDLAMIQIGDLQCPRSILVVVRQRPATPQFTVHPRAALGDGEAHK